MGTTVLNDSLVDGLRGRQESLQQQASELRDQAAGALQQAAALERFAADLQPFVLANRLAATPVVVLTAEAADADAVDEAAAALEMAGAQIVTTISVQASMTGANGSDAQGLATLLGLPEGTAPEDLMDEAAGALAARLASGPARAQDPQEDLLGRLLSGGFVVAPALSDAGLLGVGGPEQVVIAIGGGSAASRSASEGFLAPLVANLAELEVLTVAAEGSDPTSTFVSTVRDRTAAGGLVTVDGLDQAVGGSALVLGIDSATLTGQGGSWGVGDQASQPLPPPPA